MASGSRLSNRRRGLQADWQAGTQPASAHVATVWRGSPSFPVSIAKGMIRRLTPYEGRMDNRDSGVFRLASVGNYLDALAAITEEMSLKERSNLIFLDRCLHELWGLGQNVILNWCAEGDGITLIVIPHYGVAAYSSTPQIG